MNIDTRETDEIIKYVQKTFKDKVTFTVKKLDEGDYETERCLFERKTIKDLYSSVMDGRLQKQCCRMAQHEDKVIGLVIYGDIDAYVKEQRVKYKRAINPRIMTSAVAEMMCRYNLTIIWAEDQKRAFTLMIDFMLDVDAGQYQIPTRCTPEILSARLLGITPKQFKDLCDVIGTRSLCKIGKATTTQLMRVRGIGEKKAENIKKVLNGD